MAGTTPKPSSGNSENFIAPTWAAITKAHTRIAPRIHRTSVLTNSSLDALTRARIFFKCENFQKTGSFKIRGAANTVLSLPIPKPRTESLRNPAAIRRGHRLCRRLARSEDLGGMPRNSPAVKYRAVEGYGAQVTLANRPSLHATKLPRACRLKLARILFIPTMTIASLRGRPPPPRSCSKKSRTWTPFCSGKRRRPLKRHVPRR